ncbi:MAG: hypothetical protein IT285_01825 [Bdellovibrionales bacterium]|nr:hypothetical protein [Bdellovibrionales bacterium]
MPSADETQTFTHAHPREIAVRLVHQVLTGLAQYDPLFEQATRGMDPRARAWLREVTVGALRWKGRAGFILGRYAQTKFPKGQPLGALLIAIYQILQGDAPPGAVVSETVEWFKLKEGEPPAGFANAVLRRVVSERDYWMSESVRPAEGSPEEADWFSIPHWMWTRILKARGVEWAHAFARASMERPALWVRARRGEWKPDWAEKGLIPGSWRASAATGAVNELAGFADSEFLVQDISNQRLIEEVTELVGEPGPGPVLDPCASPGGKAVGLAWKGFRVAAFEKNERRHRRLKENLDRLAPDLARLEPWESWEKWPEGGERAAGVWVDAPCTGSGTLRRNPEIRWLRGEKDLESLVAIQRELVQSSWECVPIGGWMAYSVCSILAEEGEGLLDWSSLRGSRELRRWLFSPHEAPFGDGFWGILLRREA